MTKRMPAGDHSVTPNVTFRSSLKAIECYKRAFGAEALEAMPGPDGRSTMHATIRIGDSILMMGDEMPHAVAAGATATMPVADMF